MFFAHKSGAWDDVFLVEESLASCRIFCCRKPATCFPFIAVLLFSFSPLMASFTSCFNPAIRIAALILQMMKWLCLDEMFWSKLGNGNEKCSSFLSRLIEVGIESKLQKFSCLRSLHEFCMKQLLKIALWSLKSPLVLLGPNQLNNFINLVLGNFNSTISLLVCFNWLPCFVSIALNSWL